MSKRPADDGESSSGGGATSFPSPPPSKYQKIQFQPLNFGPISTLEEMDNKTLRFQNKKLAQKLEQRQRSEALLRQRIEQLEKRQTQDDALLNVVNRYWNQLNEDIRILLQRFDAEATDDGEEEKGPAGSFLTQLATWDCQELEKKLAQRVQTSQRAVHKVLQAFDHMLQRQERLSAAIKDLTSSTSTDDEEDEQDDEKHSSVVADEDDLKNEERDKEKGEDDLSPSKDDKSDRRNGSKRPDSENKDKEKDDGDEEEKKREDEPGTSTEDEERRKRRKEKYLKQLRDKEREKRRRMMSKRPRKEGEEDMETDDADRERRKSRDRERERRERDRSERERSDRERDRKRKRSSKAIKFDEVVKKELEECQSEVKRLHDLNVALHEQHHVMSLKLAEVQEKLSAEETASEELKNRLEEWQYECTNAQERCDKLENHLMETLEKLKVFEMQNDEKKQDTKGGNGANANKNMPNLSQKKVQELQMCLEEQRELASNRLIELEKLQQSHKEALQEVESLKMDIKHLPESIVVETVEYKCLQSQFSVLYNEALKLQTQLEEARLQLMNSKAETLRNIEQMESEELICQKKLRTEMIELEDVVAQLRKEYEMLRMQFEKNLVTHEQTQPINREMRNLIQSLQTHNQQLKGEVNRYKTKCKDLQMEVERLQKEVEKAALNPPVKREDASSAQKCENEDESQSEDVSDSKDRVKGEDDIKGESPAETKIKTEAESKEGEEKKVDAVKNEAGTSKKKSQATKVQSNKADLETIRELRIQLKKAQNEQKEMKLLLDMYKGAAKEQRDKVALMAAERKAKNEIDELKQQLKKLQETKQDEKKRMSEEEALKKIAKLEEEKRSLTKSVAAHKAEIDAIIEEMEVTGQAFEDMQEQNARLISQMREKDDANFKLMADRIKSNQVNKLAREEKTMLSEQVNNLSTQLEAQGEVLRKLEEKDRLLSGQVVTLEKEAHLKQQALDAHRRKAVESAQAAADLKLHLEKYHTQVKEAQQMLAEKTGALEQEAFRMRRANEEIAALRRKLERAKKLEQHSADEVLVEEVRELREQLVCPSCQVKKKDAVLTKCFHVFCFECVRTRYETRQRKCPKCNAAFGANDYHRLYLT